MAFSIQPAVGDLFLWMRCVVDFCAVKSDDGHEGSMGGGGGSQMGDVAAGWGGVALIIIASRWRRLQPGNLPVSSWFVSLPHRGRGVRAQRSSGGGGGLCDNKINLHSSPLMKVPRHLLSSLAASADDGFAPAVKIGRDNPGFKGPGRQILHRRIALRGMPTQPVPPTFKNPPT